MLEFGEKLTRDAPADASACHRCRFWVGGKDKDSGVGLCHRRAPGASGWPATGRLEWCGDFRASKATVIQRSFDFSKLLVAALVLVFLVGASVVELVR